MSCFPRRRSTGAVVGDGDAQHSGEAVAFGFVVGDEDAERSLEAGDLSSVVLVPGECVLSGPTLIESLSTLFPGHLGLIRRFLATQAGAGCDDLADTLLRRLVGRYV